VNNLIVKGEPMKPITAFILGSLFLLSIDAFADVQLRKTGDAWQLVVDGTPFIMRGAQLQNWDYLANEDIPYLDRMIDYRLAYNVNTLLVPMPWSSFEPTEGNFDYRMIDSLILKCRAKGMHCIPLWFATWKNLSSGYVPGWLQSDPGYFDNQDPKGVPSGAVSPFCTRVLEADKRAFSALMNRIRTLDQNYHTVLMVQPENECGDFPGGARDFSAPANAAWNAAVPSQLMDYMVAHKGALTPWLEEKWRARGYPIGTWDQVFGANYEGEQTFLAYYSACYIDQVAAAGKTVYNLPMYVNWGYGLPSGPSWMTLDIWKAGGPNINACAPDIYETDFEFRLAQYDYQDNPVILPESQGGFIHAVWTYIEHNGVLFSRYEGEGTKYINWNNGTSGPAYALIRDMEPVITARNGALPRTMRAWGLNSSGVFDGYGVNLSSSNGILALLKMGDNDYIAGGAKTTMQLRRLYDPASGISVTSANKGHFANGQWVNDNTASLNSASGSVSYSFASGDNQLELIRFKLSGTAPKPEVAFRRPTRASSWEDNGHSRQANDGFVSSDWVSGTGAQPWWQVDLAGPCRIAAVQVVASQTNTNSSWRSGFEIEASNAPDFATFVVLGTQGSTAFTGTLTLTVQNTNEYRYLRVKKTDNATEFGFAEARIFGDMGTVSTVDIPKVNAGETRTDGFRVIRANASLLAMRTMVSARADEIEAQLLDCTGRVVSVRRGTREAVIYTGGLPRSVYQLRLKSGTTAAVRTMVLP